MSGNVLKYFGAGNTADGFYSLFDNILDNLDRLYILKGGPGTGKSALMKNVAKMWQDKGYDIEMVHCSSDADSVDAIIIPKLNAGIVDGTAPHVIEPKAPGAVEEYVNLGIAWDSKKLAPQKDKILAIQAEVSNYYKNAYDNFKNALKIHTELEQIYVKNMDFEKADDLANQLKREIFTDKHSSGEGNIKKRFLGATTPTGSVHFIENLTENIKTRYFIKGRAGTGKSTLQRSLINEAKAQNLDMEIYYCGFDPKSIDMVIFPQLSVAIFDSTSPHELFPSRTGDIIIDMYEKTVAKGTDEKFKEEIETVTEAYKSKINEGIYFLRKAKQTRDQLEAIYIEAMDFSKVDQIREEIIAELENIATQIN